MEPRTAKEHELKAEVEVLRIVSAFGVVWFHSKVAGYPGWYFGLVVFLVLNGVFSGGGLGWSASLAKRGARILLPLIFWIPLYGVRNIVEGRPIVDLSRGISAAVLTTTSLHLWYLPYVFLALLVIDRVKLSVRHNVVAVAAGVAFCAMQLTAFSWRVDTSSAGAPWTQYAHAAPAILFGIFLGGWKGVEKRTAWLLLCMQLITACIAFGQKVFGWEYLIALPLTALVVLPNWSIKTSKDSILAQTSACCFGVYLIHIAVFSVVIHLVGVRANLLYPILSFVISMVIIWLARRILPRTLVAVIAP